MALTFFSGFETGDFGEWSSIVGSPAVNKSLYLDDYHPDSASDPSSDWTDEAKAYNDNLGDYAVTTISPESWSGFIELEFSEAKWVGYIHLNWAHEHIAINLVDCDVYNPITAAWEHHSEQDEGAGGSVGGELLKKITKFRFRFYNSDGGNSYYVRLQDCHITRSGHSGQYQTRFQASPGIEYVDSGKGTQARLTFRLAVSVYPSTDCYIAGDATNGGIVLTSTGELDLYTGGNKRVDGTTVLTGDTRVDIPYYRVSWVQDTPNSDSYIYLDGVEECKYATAAEAINVRVGMITSVTGEWHMDNVVADDDNSGSTELGDIRVLRASPNAAGQYAQFDTVSGYTYCDEVPADGATTIVDDSGVSAMHRETYNLQDWDTIGGGGSDTIKAVNIWVQAYDSGNTAQGITVRDDGTDYETMLEFGKAYTWKNKLYDTNAPRASAWTPVIFTAFQAGGYSEGSKDVYMSCVMVMVAFIPAGVGIFYQATGQGTITPVGVLGLNIKIGVGAGTITPSGVLGRVIKLLVGEGTITPVGVLGAVKKFFQNVGQGVVTPIGTLALKIKLAVGSGTVTPTGALNRIIKLVVGEGVITPVGVLAAAVKFFVNVGQGTVTPVGTLARKIKLAVGSGVITPVGVLNRLIKLTVGEGTVTPAGALSAIRKIFQNVGQGIVTPVGTLGRKILLKVGSGTITPVGILGTIKRILQGVGGGTITPIGTLGRKIMLSVGSGIITPVGTLNRLIKLVVGKGIITPVGILTTSYIWVKYIGSHVKLPLWVSGPPKDIVFTDVEEEVTFHE